MGGIHHYFFKEQEICCSLNNGSIVFWQYSPLHQLNRYGKSRQVYLTHEMPVLYSYRNQSIDLHRKSIDWFLYEGNTGI